jgi:tetrahydromethanopterin:alpha-L-glutamate ligase
LKLHLGVLGSPDGSYVRDLQRAAATLDDSDPVEIRPLAFESLSVSSIGGVHPTWNEDIHAVLVRTMPMGSVEQIIFRMNALHVIQRAGTRVINPPRSLEIAIDKWLTLDVLRTHGIEVPHTVCCQTRDAAMKAWQENFQGDCVVKPIFGGEGRGIMRVTDPDVAWRVFSTLEQLRAVIYLQEFLPSQGYDLRLLVIDDAVFCVRRENPNDWRTNAGRGGRFIAHPPTFEQVDLAFRAAKAVGAWMAGIDILPTSEGRNVILEVNAVPGWKATAEALQVDIARFTLERFIQSRKESEWESSSSQS